MRSILTDRPVRGASHDLVTVRGAPLWFAGSRHRDGLPDLDGTRVDSTDEKKGPGTFALLARAVRMLVRASPATFGLVVVTAVLQGVAPNVINVAAARVIALAPQLTQSSALADAAIALGALIGALLVERVAAALAPVTTAYLTYRFTAMLDRMRMVSCGRLPGLEHFESPELSDRLKAAGWSKNAPSLLLDRIITLVRRGTMLVGALIILVALGWWVPLLVCLSAVAVGVNDWRHAGRRSGIQRSETFRLRSSDYHRDVAVNPVNAREVRLLAIGDWLADRQQRLWQDGMVGVFADLRRQLRENAVINVFRGVIVLVPLVVAIVELRQGTIGAAEFAATVFALRTAANGMYVLEGVPGGLRETIAFLPDVIAVDELPDTDPRLSTTGTAAPPTSLNDGIRFEGVVFTYPGAAEPVLNGVDLHIAAGESVALVGENGAGKSTMVKLLCRFYDPTAGRITLDGVDIREFDLAELRRRMAVIFQNFVRLPVSARENLTVATGGRSDEADLRAAAVEAGAADVVARLADGWDTVLSRDFGGVEVSGGEWQRLALARLVLARNTRDTPILVLDEPTAALDVQVEAELYERFEELTRGSTTLLISHRFSTVRMASRVAVLDDGRVTEVGSHDELMRAGGQYAELFSLQARRFQVEA
jgi:ATP-binding cassette subfamily B protein